MRSLQAPTARKRPLIKTETRSPPILFLVTLNQPMEDYSEISIIMVVRSPQTLQTRKKNLNYFLTKEHQIFSPIPNYSQVVPLHCSAIQIPILHCSLLMLLPLQQTLYSLLNHYLTFLHLDPILQLPSLRRKTRKLNQTKKVKVIMTYFNLIPPILIIRLRKSSHRQLKKVYTRRNI